MARGPFQVDPNSVAPVQDVQLSTGRTIRDTTNEDDARIRAADNAASNANLRILGSAASFAGQAAGVANQVMEVRAIAQATEEITSVRDSLTEQSQFPSVDEGAFGKEAMENPDFRETLKTMQRIKGAERTGRLTRDFVVERLNETVASAKARNPAFGAQIERAARDVLGFSPKAEFAKNLLRVTPQEQARIDLETKATRLGIAPADVQTMELAAEQVTLQKNRFELLKVKGNYDAGILGQETRSATALAYTVIADRLAEQIQAGGVTDPLQTKAFIQQQFGAQRARLLANMPAHIDASLVNTNLTTLTNEENRLLGMVDNGSLVKFIGQQKDLIVATAEQDLLNMPVLGKIYATLGADAGAEVMATISRFKDNPAALQAIFATGGPGAAELSLGLILEGAGGAIDVLSGSREPITEQEGRIAAWFATKQLQVGNSVDAEGNPVPANGADAVRLVDVLKKSGLDVTVSAFNDPRVVKTISATKEVHGQLINLVGSYESVLSQEYAGLLARGEVPTGVLGVQNGVIVDTQANVISRALSGPAFGTAKTPEQHGSAAYARWVAKANRLIKLGETYKATGVLPATVYNDPNVLLNTLVTGADESGTSLPAVKTVIKWGLNDKGQPVPIDD